MWRKRIRAVGVVLLAWTAGACSDSTGVDDDPAVAPFVGDWEATVLTLTSPVSEDFTVDLIELGATFTLNVQPSGTYTAVLTFMGQAQTEIGQVSVSGQTIILDRSFPTTDRSISTYAFDGPDRLILDGDTEFDFNLDGTADPAIAHFELVRRP